MEVIVAKQIQIHFHFVTFISTILTAQNKKNIASSFPCRVNNLIKEHCGTHFKVFM